jgi:hypothetical protein
MTKKIGVMAFVLLMFFTAGAVFSQTLQCRDPSDGTISITFNGSTVYASYSGKSKQSFDVFVKLADGTSKIVSFKFSKIPNSQTRIESRNAGGQITEVTNCSFNSY